MVKRVLKIVLILVAVIVLLLVGLIAFLSITEFNPEAVEDASITFAKDDAKAANTDEPFTVISWNIGYGGLGEESDFFMDGGEMVNPPSQEAVEKNLEGITDFIDEEDADAYMIQEVDVKSKHTDFVNEVLMLKEEAGANGGFAYNYKCEFVPIPLPPIGKVASGVATYTDYKLTDISQRIALPCPFSWPVSTANLKRCLLVTRIDLEGTDKELVLVNLHLEAYDDGEGKIAQTKVLVDTIKAEYEKGNYVIAGGDFNQSFPGVLEKYPIKDSDLWTPGILDNSNLPEGWLFAYDYENPTCRLLDAPLNADTQLYVIDGFIVSPNLNIESVKTVDLGFKYSDHNPVKLQVSFK